MSKRTRMTSMAALAGILIVGASPGAAATWDCTTDIKTVGLAAQARGVAFIGSLSDVQRERVTIDNSSGKVITFVFDVETVYEGPQAETIRVPTTTCHRLHGFRLGQTYLVSTAGDLSGPFGAPNSGDTLAWRVLGNERVELLGFDIPAAKYSDELPRPETVSQALRLLGLDDGLPPTDAAGGEARPGLPLSGLLAAMMALASAAFLVRPMARRSRQRDGPEPLQTDA